MLGVGFLCVSVLNRGLRLSDDLHLKICELGFNAGCQVFVYVCFKQRSAALG